MFGKRFNALFKKTQFKLALSIMLVLGKLICENLNIISGSVIKELIYILSDDSPKK